MHSLRLLIICLSLSACDALPPAPAVGQCAYSVRFKKFRCCNTVTKECFNVKNDDIKMEAAQCLSADDFKSMEKWVDSVVEIAHTHCR